MKMWGVKENDTKDDGCFGLQPNKWWCHTLRWGRLGEKQGSGGAVLYTGFGTSQTPVWDFKQAFEDLSQKLRRGAGMTGVGVASVWMARKATGRATRTPRSPHLHVLPKEVILSSQPVVSPLYILLSHSAWQRGKTWWTQGPAMCPRHEGQGSWTFRSFHL